MDFSGPEGWQTVIEKSITDRFDEIRTLRRDLHQNPEPSGAEYLTTKTLSDRLKRYGFTIRTGPDQRGLIVDNPHVADAPRVGMRADIDALKIQDQKQTAYCSQVSGIMHACGHDAHTATVYGAILALHDLEQSGVMKGIPWRAIFQPAEETNQGAIEMVQAGAVNGLQALFAAHMDPSRKVGTIGVRENEFTADCSELEIEVIGRGAHAARPHESCDPIAAVAQLISSIFLFVPRSTNSQEPVVVSFGQIIAGDTPNVIPDRVLVRGTLRTLHQHVTQTTVLHLERLARGVAEASGTTIHVRQKHGPPAVHNDVYLTEIITEAAKGVLG
ncbi:MAG: amidohydrolase, partial [Planctomicrobium sp.]|nr:amidohydrolase [Planctomicrobium sp.]